MSSDFLAGLKETHDAYERARRDAIAASSRAQHAAKRAIFALQREEDADAKRLLTEADEALEAVRALTAEAPRIAHEGSFRAALEEYAEARFFLQLVVTGRAQAIDGLDEETQIAGLCDAVGEGVRRMTYLVTAGRDDEARETHRRLADVVAGLDAMDYSGYLRTKYDQARSHFRKAEDVLYDLSLKSRG